MKRKPDLAADLRKAIQTSGRTHYGIGKAAAVAPEIIDRFVRGERDIRLATAGRLAEALRLRLVPEPGEDTPRGERTPRNEGRG